MLIHGFNKTTLLDYPRHLAATIFIGGCNMRCPFCHNASLVTGTASQPVLPEQEILSYLAKRTNILEGVCITGGEPTLHPDLPGLITRVKELGYRVKLDTNGTNPAMLKDLVSRGLIDYVAMDIKNSPEKYALTAGVNLPLLKPVMESVDFLLSSPLDYEFRTTVVKELHTAQDMLEIGRWLSGARAYFLQAYKDSGDILSPGLSSPSAETLKEYVRLLVPFIPAVSLRGVD
ncbi:pyruvate formate lyase activating enzyme [Anaerotaenia torta]|uniref:anaerobic ribonucleoside-triphosphate reductase activating protein n=1 Tax=Anaerotaenia torta TaxID=433293 RepID=UPI003D207828